MAGTRYWPARGIFSPPYVPFSGVSRFSHTPLSVTENASGESFVSLSDFLRGFLPVFFCLSRMIAARNVTVSICSWLRNTMPKTTRLCLFSYYNGGISGTFFSAPGNDKLRRPARSNMKIKRKSIEFLENCRRLDQRPTQRYIARLSDTPFK